MQPVLNVVGAGGVFLRVDPFLAHITTLVHLQVFYRHVRSAVRKALNIWVDMHRTREKQHHIFYIA